MNHGIGSVDEVVDAWVSPPLLSLSSLCDAGMMASRSRGRFLQRLPIASRLLVRAPTRQVLLPSWTLALLEPPSPAHRTSLDLQPPLNGSTTLRIDIQETSQEPELGTEQHSTKIRGLPTGTRGPPRSPPPKRCLTL